MSDTTTEPTTPVTGLGSLDRSRTRSSRSPSNRRECSRIRTRKRSPAHVPEWDSLHRGRSVPKARLACSKVSQVTEQRQSRTSSAFPRPLWRHFSLSEQ